MPKWVHADVLDNGLNNIKTNANAQWLLKAYAPGDSYATATGNMIADAAMAPGDYTLGSSGSNRTLTTASGKADAAANAGSTQYVTGTATAGGATTLTDSAKSWTTNEHAARALVVASGTGAGQARRIASNSATVVTVDTAWSTNPDATSVYWIVDDLYIAFVDTVNSKVLWVTDETSNQVVTAGNPVNFPVLVYTAQQPS